MLRISRDAARLVIATGLASAIGLAANVEAGAAEWQSASDVQEVLIGTGTELSGYEEGSIWKERYEPGGTIKGLGGADGYKGKWSFKGDLMCFDYEGTADDGCWYLAVKGDKVFWWKEDGTPDGDDKVLRK